MRDKHTPYSARGGWKWDYFENNHIISPLPLRICDKLTFMHPAEAQLRG